MLETNLFRRQMLMSVCILNSRVLGLRGNVMSYWPLYLVALLKLSRQWQPNNCRIVVRALLVCRNMENVLGIFLIEAFDQST